ncbi:hypothetical protein C0214_19425 [Methylobacterium sp. DM1]|nr:hypothetical protein C0214_19425 [Methylobacterium sp. DM1]
MEPHINGLADWLVEHGGVGTWAAATAARRLLLHKDSPVRLATPARRTDGGMTAGEVAHLLTRMRAASGSEDEGGDCSCNVAGGSDAWQLHDPFCAYRVICEAVNVIEATPAQPAGAVPDSLRALPIADIRCTLIYLTRGLSSATADKVRNVYLPALERAEDALASHPAGQSAGSSERIAEIVNRWHDWIVSASADMDQPEWSSGSRQTMEDDRDFLLRALPAQKSAPDSTRTGDEEVKAAQDAWNYAVRTWGETWVLNEIGSLVEYARLAVPALAARPADPEAQGAEECRTHLLPDANAPRHSWNHVKHMVAKSRAAALKEAADLARTHALICGTTRQDIIGSVDTLAAELKKLAKEASDALTPAPPASSGQGGR